jgi:hypothetical protein
MMSLAAIGRRVEREKRCLPRHTMCARQKKFVSHPQRPDRDDNQPALQLWLVLEEDPVGKTGCAIVHRAEPDRFGRAVGGIVIGIYGSFIQAFEAMEAGDDLSSCGHRSARFVAHRQHRKECSPRQCQGRGSDRRATAARTFNAGTAVGYLPYVVEDVVVECLFAATCGFRALVRKAQSCSVITPVTHGRGQLCGDISLWQWLCLQP